MKGKLYSTVKAVLNTYAIVFFSQNKVCGLLLLLATFLNPLTGLTGLLFALGAIAYASYNKFAPGEIEKGIYSFNALLLGLAFGTFYHVNLHFYVWAVFACLACVLFTIIFNSWSVRKNLPFLSLPFIITFSLVFSAANSVYNLGLEQRKSIILDELSAHGILNNTILPFIHFPYYLSLYFKALGAVVFQESSIAGLIIAVGLFIHSRIAFSLSILAFTAAIALNTLTGTYPEGLSTFHLGSNIMLTVMGLGSFFQIPSWRTYLYSLISIPFIFLLINALTKLLGIFDLPIISLPFCLATLFFIRTLVIAKSKWFPTVQTYFPEANFYMFLSGAERLNDFKYFDIKLPFLGEWVVNQGYNGGITHKNEWGQALDFVVKDENGQTYRGAGTLPENYYCFGKPILSCGNGIIEEVINHIADNAIGSVNLQENWGNTIIIKHTNGLYSKVSHLKQGSVKVNIGDYVQQGDIIALCGNSGRSPEPHLHFQVQSTTYIEAKTLAYPFSSYLDNSNIEAKLKFHETPSEGHRIKAIVISDMLRQAFDFRLGYIALLINGDSTEMIGLEIDEFNRTYLFSKENNAKAYFINNGTSHYFTEYEGNKKSMLYLFHRIAYKIIFANNIEINDNFPLHLEASGALRWLQDLILPFYRFIELTYRSVAQLKGGRMDIETSTHQKIFNKEKDYIKGKIQLNAKGLQRFEIIVDNKKTIVEWVGQNV